MNKFNVTVVIPNYNGEQLLKKNLPSVIEAFDYKQNNIIEIVVVDDASEDESVKLLKEKYPKVKVIKHSINRGFSSSVNTGVRMAKGNLVALLNSDVSPRKNFIEKSISLFKDKLLFAVSFNEGKYSWAKAEFKDGFIHHYPGPKTTKTHPTFWVSGGSGIFNRQIWTKLGGMDEKLLNPFYWEDIDICYRAQKRGYKLLWEPSAIVDHKHEGTISKLSPKYVQRIRERNELLVIWKNISSKRLIRKHRKALLDRILHHPGYLLIFLLAILKIRKTLELRRKEIRESTVSDETILTQFQNI